MLSLTLWPPRLVTVQVKVASLPIETVTFCSSPINVGVRPMASEQKSVWCIYLLKIANLVLIIILNNILLLRPPLLPGNNKKRQHIPNTQRTILASDIPQGNLSSWEGVWFLLKAANEQCLDSLTTPFGWMLLNRYLLCGHALCILVSMLLILVWFLNTFSYQ